MPRIGRSRPTGAYRVVTPQRIDRVAAGAIAVRSFAEYINHGNASFVVDKPSGVVDGDLLIAFIACDSDGTAASLTAPAGWTQTGPDAENASCVRARTFYRIASSEPTSYTFGTLAVSDTMCKIIAFTGADTTSPIDVDATYTPYTTPATDIDAPTVTVGSGSALLCGFVSQGGGNFSTPTGMAEITDTTTNWIVTSVDLQAVTAGATGVRTSTHTVNQLSLGMSLVLRSVSTGTNASAGTTTVTATANNATAKSSPTAGAATATTAANAATVVTSVQVPAGTATASALALGGTTKASTGSGSATATATANNATVTGVSVAPAGTATATATANNATVQAVSSGQAVAQTAAATGTAYDATIPLAGDIDGHPSEATGTATALDATVKIAPTAITATATALGQAATAKIAPTPTAAPITAVARDALAVKDVDAIAQTAQATTAGQVASTKIRTGAGSATAVGLSNAVHTTPNAAAAVASGTAQALDAESLSSSNRPSAFKVVIDQEIRRSIIGADSRVLRVDADAPRLTVVGKELRVATVDAEPNTRHLLEGE